ncbi:hypothetical protein ABZ569_32785 [Streptomyces albus]|uniref:hypothetical protein n=1 Tax=Streptomyces albus TaxID=1888 RepID=UPI00340C9EED
MVSATMTAQQAIAAFLERLEQEGYSPATRRVRRRWLAEYLDHALNEQEGSGLSAAELMELPRADAWLTAAAAGRTRERNTASGPHSPAARDTQRSRIITYNQLAEWLGTPWRLEVPPPTTGEHLDPEEARAVINTLATQRPVGTKAATAIRTAAVAALVADTGLTVAQIAVRKVGDLVLDAGDPPPRLLYEGEPYGLAPETVDVLERWLAQRAEITRPLQGSDPGHLWVPVQPGPGRGARSVPEPTPPGVHPAHINTLRAAHRRLVLEILGRPVRPGQLRAAGEDPLTALGHVHGARDEIDLHELKLIDHARAHNRSWTEIAAALGLPSRRDAQARFRQLAARWPDYPLRSRPGTHDAARPQDADQLHAP